MSLKTTVRIDLTREELNTLLASLDRAAMELAADGRLNTTFRVAWLEELGALKRKLLQADTEADWRRQDGDYRPGGLIAVEDDACGDVEMARVVPFDRGAQE